MVDYENIFKLEPYSLKKYEKYALLTDILNELTEYHRSNCNQYTNILKSINFSATDTHYDIPFLPARLFKELDLLSIDRKDLFKTMISSGTTGQAVSKIYLDRETANLQQKTLVKIVSNFTGTSRMPMLIIDCPSVIKNRAMFSARGAGILGFSILGANITYALNDHMELDLEAIYSFLDRHKGKQILLFGFTFIIWQHFYLELLKRNIQIDLSHTILIHGGGWKKLTNQSVNSHEFKESLSNNICGITKIYDYYGMVEQTGCIYMECEHGYFHASIFSDIITRRHTDFSPCEVGEKGIIQVLSVLPKSYPGHSLLTEDEGIILGEDNCLCGRLGKYFKIVGRVKNAEIRGCSDTYEPEF